MGQTVDAEMRGFFWTGVRLPSAPPNEQLNELLLGSFFTIRLDIFPYYVTLLNIASFCLGYLIYN